MKNKFFKIFYLLFLITSINNLISSIPIKVLLEEKSSKNKSQITIKANKGMLLSIPSTTKKLLIKASKINILIKDNSIYLPIINPDNNSKQIFKVKSKELRLSPALNKIKLEKNHYQGQLIIKIDEKSEKVFFINKLDLDDYIYSVLVSECYQSWPMEMQKIQAVISRTYALFHLLQSKDKKIYDIKRSNFHQTYGGFHNYTHLRQAIKDTENIVITYNNKIALTMFDACCGGLIPAKMNVLDFKKAPYLARKNPCNFCKNYGLYKWRRQIPIYTFMQRLHNEIKNISPIGYLQNIIVTKKDEAGIVNSVKLFGTRKNLMIPGIKLWEIFRDKIKSLNFNIRKYNNNIIFEGKGFGHQIGLCQRGAKELVQRGWDFKNIIKFYYPGIRFALLTDSNNSG